MKLKALVKPTLAALALVAISPLAFAADEPAPAAGQEQNREPSSKHKGKHKHRKHGRKHHRK